MKAVTAGKTIYGLPTSNYTQGLIYNRKLFSEAGPEPRTARRPPGRRWRQDATAIAKLGNGIEGWGDYSAGNNGGWHFSSYIDALGGSMVNNSGAAADGQLRQRRRPWRSCRRCTSCGSPTTR